jgi:hypothetical protein
MGIEKSIHAVFFFSDPFRYGVGIQAITIFDMG